MSMLKQTVRGHIQVTVYILVTLLIQNDIINMTLKLTQKEIGKLLIICYFTLTVLVHGKVQNSYNQVLAQNDDVS